MPKEVFATQPRAARYRAYEDSPPAPGQLLVHVDFAAPKHGTEYTLFRDLDPFRTHTFGQDGYELFLRREAPPAFAMAPGNIWVGRVAALGADVRGYAVGDRVSGYGGLRPTQLATPENCRHMPARMTWQEAVCYDPAQFALGGIRDGHVCVGDHVAVFGLGAIGQMTAQLAALAGAAQVIVIDPVAFRRAVAMKNGASLALDPTACDAGLEIRKATGKRGADVTIETSGTYEALQQAIRGAAYAANVAVVGWYKACKGGLDFGFEAHFNQPNLIFSRACSEPNREYPRWSFDRLCAACWALLAEGRLACDNIIDPVVPFDKAAETYMHIERDPSDSVKMGVTFDTASRGHEA